MGVCFDAQVSVFFSCLGFFCIKEIQICYCASKKIYICIYIIIFVDDNNETRKLEEKLKKKKERESWRESSSAPTCDF